MMEHYQPHPQKESFQPPMQLSLTGRTIIPAGDPALDLSFSRGSPYSPIAGNCRGRNDINHNQVEIGRIQLGLDVRTTVSLPYGYGLFC